MSLSTSKKSRYYFVLEGDETEIESLLRQWVGCEEECQDGYIEILNDVLPKCTVPYDMDIERWYDGFGVSGEWHKLRTVSKRALKKEVKAIVKSLVE